MSEASKPRGAGGTVASDEGKAPDPADVNAAAGAPPQPPPTPPAETDEQIALKARIAELEKQNEKLAKANSDLEEKSAEPALVGPVSRDAKGNLYIGNKKVGTVVEPPKAEE